MCNPNWKEIDCGTKDNPKFITEYECLGNPDLNTEYADLLKKNSQTSFFSGHASIAWASASFIFFYSRKKLQSYAKQSIVVKLHTVVQLLCIGLAMYVSYTRIDDYWHHPTDVFVGSMVGIVCQYLNAQYLM